MRGFNFVPIRSDPMLIFLSGNRPLESLPLDHVELRPSLLAYRIIQLSSQLQVRMINTPHLLIIYLLAIVIS